MKRVVFLAMMGALAGFLAGLAPALAQPADQAAPPPAAAPAAPDYSQVEEVSTDLGKGLFMIAGAGGNTTLAVGSKGLIVVDTQFAPLYDKLRAKITSLSDKPILYVVNTHYHGDHTGGNAQFYEKDMAVIVAHPQVAARMIDPPPGANGQPGTPAVQNALPNAPYGGISTVLDAGSLSALLTHPQAAHTDGDTIVVFLSADVIATGDTVTTASYPNIDLAGGGTIDGMIGAAKFVISQSDNKTKIVPGHGPLTNKQGVTEYLGMLQTAHDRIAKAKAAGMTEDQVVNANLLADMDKRWKPAGNAMAARFPINVYRSLK